MKLALAVPSYGPFEPNIDKHLRVAIMTPSNHGITWAGDVSTIRSGWVDGRNASAEAAIDAEGDGLFWMDDDIMLPPEAIVKLASYGKDFTSGMYFQKYFPHWPLFAMYNGKKFNWFRDFPEEDRLFEVDGVGFGCALTSTKLLKALKEKHGKCFEWTEFSEDVAGISGPSAAGSQRRAAAARASASPGTSARYETPQAPIQAEIGSAPGISSQE